MIQKKDFIKEGDYIKIDEKEGEVINTNLIEVIIKTKEGEIVYVPNSILTKKVITKTKVKE